VAAFREDFGVPAERLPIGAITVGHRVADPGTAGSPSHRPRRSLDEVVHRGRWTDRTDQADTDTDTA
jgi:nitroreductase